VNDLTQLATDLARRGRGSEQVEAFLSHQKSFNVKAYQGEVESISSAEPRGAGVRIVGGGRVGFAYTTDLTPSGLERLITEARENAAHTTEDDAVILADAWERAPEPIAELWDDSLPSVTPESKVAFAIELEGVTRSHDPRIRAVEEAVYADSESEIAIVTSTGISGHYRRSDAWCYSLAIATDEDDTQVGFDFGLERGFGALSAEAVGRSAAERALGVLGAEKIPSARMPVVFEPYTAGQFLGVIGAALTGESVQKGRSLFAGKIGEKVAAEGLSLIDDGRAQGAPGSEPWDAEGTPTRRTEVIADGVLKSFLYDTISGRREGRTSTGNAARASFKSVPYPAPTNLCLASVEESREAIYSKAGRALLVQDFHGVHSGANSVTGDFSVGATGRLLEDGVPGRPVKEVTIAAPMLDILKRIESVGSDLRWLPFGGSYGGATTLISEMTVAGR
jgi:PmbA protein